MTEANVLQRFGAVEILNAFLQVNVVLVLVGVVDVIHVLLDVEVLKAADRVDDRFESFEVGIHIILISSPSKLPIVCMARSEPPTENAVLMRSCL